LSGHRNPDSLTLAIGLAKPAGKGILQRIGTTGKGTYYNLKKQGLIKGSKGSPKRKGSWHRLMIIMWDIRKRDRNEIE
jgi:hypothetical protein